MKNKKFWKKGSAEIFGFIVFSPLMIILFALLVSIVQAGSLKEKLEYTTYVAARAAAVSSTLEEAKENAEKAAEIDLASYGADYKEDSLKVKVSLVSGRKWDKGSYLKCEVSVKFTGVTNLVNGKKKFSLIMAVEHEDTDKAKKKETS